MAKKGWKNRMPNQGARELNEFTSWHTISRGLTAAANYGNRANKIRYEFSDTIAKHRDGSMYGTYCRFTGGLQGVIGTLGGKLGRDIDGAIRASLKSIDLKGAHRIGGGDLSKILGSLQQSIDRISSGTVGVEGTLLRELSNKLGSAAKSAEKGGFNTLRGGDRDAIRSAYGFRGNATVDDAVKGFASEVKKVSGSISNVGLQQDVEKVKDDMLRAAKAATSVAEKQKALATAGQRLSVLQKGATGSDRAVIDGLAKTATRNSQEVAKNLTEQHGRFRSAEFTNKLENLSRAIGTSTRIILPLKRTLDLGNSIFQNFNGKFNQFARMQMRIASERGGFGRQLRGAGINYGHMMGALSAGRSAGMDDRTVVNHMVDLQTQLSQARWGEGDLIKSAGRWGISTYDANGDVKEANQMMIDFSRKLNSLGSKMEKLQFLHHLNFRPEQMEYVANYEKEARRQEYLKAHPEMMGTLDKGTYLDESGLSAKADAYTKVELRRREVLNEDAIEQGVIPALKRSLNPENWLFSDWTARRQGMKQAKGDQALEKLTRAIEERVAQEKEKGRGVHQIGALHGLTADDLAAISEIAKAEKADKGEKSAAAVIDKAYLDQFGIKLDVRTPIEKLQSAIEPLTNKIADGVERIADWLSKSKLTNSVSNNPWGWITGILSAIVLLKVGKAFGGGFLRKAGGNLADKVMGRGRGGAAVKATAEGTGSAVSGGVAETVAKGSSKLGIFSSIRNWFVGSGRKVAPETPIAVIAEGAAGKGVSGAAGNGAVGAVVKGGLKRAGGPLLNALYFGYDAYSAKGQYEQGDIKGGNNTLASSAGGILGGMAGGAIAGLAAGSLTGPGAVITGIVGAIVGGIAGAIGGGSISDALSEHYAVPGSEAWRIQQEGYRENDTVVRDPEEATKHFLNGLREALRNNNTQRAMEILTKNGIHGLDIEALKNDEGFMKDDTKAQQTLHGAVQAQALSQYAYLTGKSLSMEDFARAASTDKYLSTAAQLGVNMDQNEAVHAAMRGTGETKGATPSLAVMNAYVKDGWKTNKDAIRNEETAIRNENPEMSEDKVKKEAEKRVKEKNFESLTSEDLDNYAKAMQEEGNLHLEHASLVEEASKFGINSKGQIRSSKGELMDAEGFLVDSNGARVDRKGRHEGDEGYEATRVDENGLSGDALKAYNKLQNFRKDHNNADEMSLNKRSLDNWGNIATSKEAAEKAALNSLKNQGMDVENRGFNQMFESEQLDALEKAVYGTPDEKMSVGGKLAQFANENGISLDQARNMLKKVGIRDVESSEQVHLGSDSRNEEKARKRESQKKDRKKENAELAKSASQEDLEAAIKDDANLEYYEKLRNKSQNGEILSENEQSFLDRHNSKIASKVRAKQRMMASKHLHSEQMISKEAQTDIDEALRSGRESADTFEKNRKKKPLAQLSDMRQMQEMAKQGYTRKQITRRFGKDRMGQLEAEIKKGAIKDPFNNKRTRRNAKKEALEDANDKKHGHKKPGFPTEEEASAEMKKKTEGADQAASKMAANGAAAEAAAASAKNAQTGIGTSSSEKNVTINLGGQTITQNINGNIPLDADGIKGATERAGCEGFNKLPSLITSVAESKGII